MSARCVAVVARGGERLDACTDGAPAHLRRAAASPSQRLRWKRWNEEGQHNGAGDGVGASLGNGASGTAPRMNCSHSAHPCCLCLKSRRASFAPPAPRRWQAVEISRCRVRLDHSWQPGGSDAANERKEMLQRNEHSLALWARSSSLLSLRDRKGEAELGKPKRRAVTEAAAAAAAGPPSGVRASVALLASRHLKSALP